MKKKIQRQPRSERGKKKKSPAAAADRPRLPEVDGAARRGARSWRGACAGRPDRSGDRGDSGAQDAGAGSSAAGKARAGGRAGLRACERAGGSRAGVGRGAARSRWRCPGRDPARRERRRTCSVAVGRRRGAGQEVPPGLCARAAPPGPRNLVPVPARSWGQRRLRAGHVLRSWGRRDAPRRGVGTCAPRDGAGGRAKGSPGMGEMGESPAAGEAGPAGTQLCGATCLGSLQRLSFAAGESARRAAPVSRTRQCVSAATAGLFSSVSCCLC